MLPASGVTADATMILRVFGGGVARVGSPLPTRPGPTISRTIWLPPVAHDNGVAYGVRINRAKREAGGAPWDEKT